MPRSYDGVFVILSVIVAMLASFAALDLARRVRSESGTTRLGWIAGGGTVMGLGIWSMHFVGMLAFHLPVPIGYDVPLMLLSVVVAIAASFLALIVINRPRLGLSTLVPGGMLMGVAIAGMHYIGMASVRADARLTYIGSLVALSVLIAIVASLAALWLAFRFRSDLTAKGMLLKVLSAVVMGIAISGMHYTAMAAARFAPSRPLSRSVHYILASGELGGAVVVSAILVIVLALIGSVIDRNMQARSAFIRDLTERKKAAEALRLGEQHYRELFEDVPVGLYRSTPDGRLIDANPAMVSMLGYPDRESLLATPATALYVDPADRLRWSAEMARAGVVRDFEVQMHRGDGAVIWARDTTHAKREADRRVVLYEGVIEDITDRVEAERRLQASERRLIQILETVPLGIFVTDYEGHPVFANAAAQKILGRGAVPDLAVAGLAETYKAYVAGTDQLYPVERMPLVRALSGETAAIDDMEIRQGVRVVSLNVQGAPILDNEGKVVAAVAAFMDTTDRRSLEAQFRQSQKMEAIGRLAGGVAHDFNNILTVIRMSSEFLIEDLPDTHESRHEAKEIMKAADRAAALTRQLLAFSRHQVLNPRLVVLNDIIEGLDGMLRRVVPENIEVKTELETKLDPIKADTGQLELVLLNLVINAADAMPNGGRIDIRTSNVEVDSAFSMGHLDVGPGSYVCLTLSDTGHGMDKETVSRIFEPFFTTKPVGKGTGLGLATVHGIVTQTGGNIWVYSEPGQGTTFKIFIPRSEGVARLITPRSVKQLGPATETILLVEDEAATRDAIQRSLTRAGYKVLLAANGVEALTIANSNPKAIDLVLSDSMMPEMGGLELVTRLRKTRPDMSFLMMSGYTEQASPERFGLTPLPFIEKPFAAAALLAAIQLLLHGEEDPVATG